MQYMNGSFISPLSFYWVFTERPKTWYRSMSQWLGTPALCNTVQIIIVLGAQKGKRVQSRGIQAFQI